MATTRSLSLSRLLSHLAEESRKPALNRSFNGVYRLFSSKPAGADDGIMRPVYFPSSSCGTSIECQEDGIRKSDMDINTYVHSKECNVINHQAQSVLSMPSPGGCTCHISNGHQVNGLTRRVSVNSFQKHGPLIPSGYAPSLIQSNSYASSSRFEDKAKIRALMESRGLKKEPGWSRIEIQGQLNTFLVDDRSHPRNQEIRAELQRMLGLMKEAGYVADIRCVLRDIPDSEKENALQHHSERLAMALGHISLPPRAPLRVIKNLRVCNDCHVATKYFAYICKREIIVRDATRFHHFKEGYCSCGDYW